MKILKFLAAAGAVALATVGIARSARVVYNTTLVNESALAYNNTYTLDLGNSQLTGSNIDSISFQAVYSSASPAAVTFIDGTKSTATITISSYTALVGSRATAWIQVSSNTALAGTQGYDNITVASNTFLAANNVELYLDGTTLTSNGAYTVGSSSIVTASNLATAINKVGPFTATASGGVVNVKCTQVGDSCNSRTVASSSAAALSVATAKFAGGYNNAYFSINGIALVQGIDWFKQDTASNTAINIVNAINSYSGFSFLTSTCDVGAVISSMTVNTTGYAGNSYTLATSTNALTISSTSFLGGKDNGFVVANGKIFTSMVDFQAVTSTGITATNIATTINASSNTIGIVSGTGPNGVVTATSTVVGANTNYDLFTSSSAAATVTNHNRLYGGTDSNVSASVFNLSAHGLTTGMPVLFTVTSGTPPQNMIANTTYYAIKVDANNFKLAATQGNAIVSTYTAITISTVTGSGSFKLTPLAISGTPSFKWQVSDDNSNWSDFTTTEYNVSIGSVTMSSLAPATTVWDFGPVNHRYVRLNVVGPTQGGISLVVTGVGKSSQ